MKIKITESQATRLKLINEDVNPLTSFELYCKIKVRYVNEQFLKVQNLTVSEILSGDINLEALSTILNDLESELSFKANRTTDYINNLDDGTYDELDVRIDNAQRLVSNKLDALSIIVLTLEKLQESNDDNILSKQFSDVAQLDIT